MKKIAELLYLLSCFCLLSQDNFAFINQLFSKSSLLDYFGGQSNGAWKLIFVDLEFGSIFSYCER